MSYSVDLDLNYTISVDALQPQYDTKGDTFMKKTLCLILAVCMMLLCLAACSSGKTTDADKTDAASNETTQSDTAADSADTAEDSSEDASSDTAVDPSTLNVGDEFTVQLLNNGEPMADVDIIPDVLNHHTETIKTDENGMATVTASNGGLNVIGCEMVVPYENEGVDQKATRSKVFVSLSFTLYPEEED